MLGFGDLSRVLGPEGLHVIAAEGDKSKDDAEGEKKEEAPKAGDGPELPAPGADPLADPLGGMAPMPGMGGMFSQGEAVRDIFSGEEGVVAQQPSGNLGEITFVTFGSETHPIRNDQLEKVGGMGAMPPLGSESLGGTPAPGSPIPGAAPAGGPIPGVSTEPQALPAVASRQQRGPRVRGVVTAAPKDGEPPAADAPIPGVTDAKEVWDHEPDDEEIREALEADGVEFYDGKPSADVKFHGFTISRHPALVKLLTDAGVPEELWDEAIEGTFESCRERFWEEVGAPGFYMTEDLGLLTPHFVNGIKVYGAGRSGGHLIMDVSLNLFTMVTSEDSEGYESGWGLDPAMVDNLKAYLQRCEDAVKEENVASDIESQLEIDLENGQFGGEMLAWWEEQQEKAENEPGSAANMRAVEREGQQRLPLESRQRHDGSVILVAGRRRAVASRQQRGPRVRGVVTAAPKGDALPAGDAPVPGVTDAKELWDHEPDDEEIREALENDGVEFYDGMPSADVKFHGFTIHKHPALVKMLTDAGVPEELWEKAIDGCFEGIREQFWDEVGAPGFYMTEDLGPLTPLFKNEIKVHSAGRSGGHLVLKVSLNRFVAVTSEDSEGYDSGWGLDPAMVDNLKAYLQRCEDAVKEENVAAEVEGQLEIDLEMGQFGGEMAEWWEQQQEKAENEPGSAANMRAVEREGQQRLPLESRQRHDGTTVLVASHRRTKISAKLDTVTAAEDPRMLLYADFLAKVRADKVGTHEGALAVIGYLPPNWDLTVARLVKDGVALRSPKASYDVMGLLKRGHDADEVRYILAAKGVPVYSVDAVLKMAAEEPTTPAPSEDPGAGMTWAWDKTKKGWFPAQAVNGSVVAAQFRRSLRPGMTAELEASGSTTFSEKVGDVKVRIYDAGEEFADRYTVVLERPGEQQTEWVGLTEHGNRNSIGEGGRGTKYQEGRHLGKRVIMRDLTEEARNAINYLASDSEA